MIEPMEKTDILLNSTVIPARNQGGG